MTPHIAVIGGGPAGLMAAERLGAAGLRVALYERMPSVGRKFLMAGRGGLNLTHSEPLPALLRRYGEAQPYLAAAIEAFPPAALRAWAENLGQPTFVGSSGRVFPVALKASPLLRAWLVRLRSQGVDIRLRRQWLGWDSDGLLCFATADGAIEKAAPDATLLALGGASWPKLGSDGGWVPILEKRGIQITPLRPSNSGFRVAWSEVFRSRFEGQPLKNVAFRFGERTVRGEAMVTRDGLEGGAVYALSPALREATTGRSAELMIDLRPDVSPEALTARLRRTRPGQSRANILRKAAGLTPLASNLLREAIGTALPGDPEVLASAIKALPLTILGPQPLERAISAAGGIGMQSLDERFMLRDLPGVFAAGEMLDWEAPTGGYLLQACFATGLAAAEGVVAWFGSDPQARVRTKGVAPG